MKENIGAVENRYKLWKGLLLKQKSKFEIGFSPFQKRYRFLSIFVLLVEVKSWCVNVKFRCPVFK